MSTPSLSELIGSTRDSRASVTVLKETKTIPVEITEYVVEGDDVIARGVNQLNQQNVEVKLKYTLRDDNSKTNRSMSDIREVTPEGTVVIFKQCFEDEKNPGRFTSYYARTPNNTLSTDPEEEKNVSVSVLPGRMVRTPTGRVAGLFYNVQDGVAITDLKQVVDAASKLFAAKKGVYLRVRVNTEEDGEVVKQNEAFEFLPVYDTVVNADNSKTSVVNIQASVAKIMESPIGKLWLSNIDSYKEYLGTALNIDLMPISTAWTSASAFREGKKSLEEKSYGLAKPNGLFAQLQHLYNNAEGQQARLRKNVATNMIVSILDQTKNGLTRTTLLGADTLSTRSNFISVDELPIYINGQSAYTPAPDKVMVRMQKSDGTFLVKTKEEPNADLKSATKAEEQSEAAVEVDIPSVDESPVHVPETSLAEHIDEAEAVFSDPQSHIDDDFDSIEDIDVESILAEMEQSQPQEAAAPSPKM